ncbi:hypothetical protein PMAYCL1PPCAC_23100, partial [Pristionchus mayeri]
SMGDTCNDGPPLDGRDNEENEIREMALGLDNVQLQEDTNEYFPFLDLPDKIITKVYPYLDLASRRALRVNRRLEGIEMGVKYRYGTMNVVVEGADVIISCDEAEMKIPHSDVEREFELLGKNTSFDKVSYKSIGIENRLIVQATRFLKSKEIRFDDPKLNDDDLKSVVQNKLDVIINNSEVYHGYMWIYKKMRERQLDLKFVSIASNDTDDRYDFMLDMKKSKKRQKVERDEDTYYIIEGLLYIVVCDFEGKEIGCDDEDDPIYEYYGFISFQNIEDEE